jgi:hypothetical protein
MALCRALLIHDRVDCITLVHMLLGRYFLFARRLLPACVVTQGRGVCGLENAWLPVAVVRRHAQPGGSKPRTERAVSLDLWLQNVCPPVSRSSLILPFRARNGDRIHCTRSDAPRGWHAHAAESPVTSTSPPDSRQQHLLVGPTSAQLSLVGLHARSDSNHSSTHHQFGRTTETLGVMPSPSHDAAVSGS